MSLDIGPLRGDVQDARAAFTARWLSVAARLGDEEVAAVRSGVRPCRTGSMDPWPDDLSLAPADPSPVPPVPPERIAPALIVPGLLGDAVRPLVAPLLVARRTAEACGIEVEMAWVNGRAGSSRNAVHLAERVQAEAERHGERVHLIAYSKGCTDALHLLAEHPRALDALRSLTSLAGVVHGTPLAAHTPEALERLLRWLPLPGNGSGDGRAIDDLEPAARAAHLAAHPLPATLRYASIVCAPRPERVSRVLMGPYRRLGEIDPRNDSQVIARDAVLPRGELLAVLDADHWAAALPIDEPGRRPARRLGRWLGRHLVTRNRFPRASLLRALLEHLSVPAA